MFDNIGTKIKVLATVICGIGIASSIIWGIILMITGANSYNGGGTVFVGILVAVLGSIGSWIGSFFTYGFGELIENSAEIRRNTYVSKAQTNIPVHQKQASDSSSQKLNAIITGKNNNATKSSVACPHCGSIVKGSPCEMCGKSF